MKRIALIVVLVVAALIATAGIALAARKQLRRPAAADHGNGTRPRIRGRARLDRRRAR